MEDRHHGNSRRIAMLSLLVVPMVLFSLLTCVPVMDAKEPGTSIPPNPPVSVTGYGKEYYCRISWMPPVWSDENPAASYRIYRSNDPDDPLLYDEIPGSELVYEDHNVSGRQSYYYWVSAVNEWGGSDLSGTGELFPKTLPDPVTKISFIPGQGEIVITWTTSLYTGNAGKLKSEVQRASKIDRFQTLFSTEVGANTTYNCTDPAPEIGVTYFYRVLISNDLGYSENGSVIEVVLDGPPSSVINLQATPSLKEIYLRWDPPANDGGSKVQGYVIKRSKERGSLQEIARLDAYTTEWVDRDPLSPGSNYYYVAAYNEYGEGEERRAVSDIESGYDDEQISFLILFLVLMLIPGGIVGVIAYNIDQRRGKEDDPDLMNVEEYLSREESE